MEASMWPELTFTFVEGSIFISEMWGKMDAGGKAKENGTTVAETGRNTHLRIQVGLHLFDCNLSPKKRLNQTDFEE